MAEADVLNSLSEINKTLRRNVAVNIRTYRNVMGLRKDMKPSARDVATEGLDEEEKKPIREANQQGTDRGKVAKEARKGFFSSFLKWFGLLGLGVFLKDEIGGFISGAFGQLKEYISDWWEKTGKPAFSNFSDSIGLTSLMDSVSDIGTNLKKFAMSIPGVKALGEFLFGKEAEYDELGLKTEGTEGLFGPIAKYAKNFGDAIVTLGKDLGLLNKDGSISTGGALVGVGALAALFTFIGPATLIKGGLKLALGTFGSFADLLLGLTGSFVSLAAKVGVEGLLKPALWAAKTGLAAVMGTASTGFLALAGKVGEGGKLQDGLLNMATGLDSFKTKLKGAEGAIPAAGADPAKGKTSIFSRLKGLLAASGKAIMGILGPLLPLLLVGTAGVALFAAITTAADNMRKKQQKEDVERGGQQTPDEQAATVSGDSPGISKKEAKFLQEQGQDVQPGQDVGDVSQEAKESLGKLRAGAADRMIFRAQQSREMQRALKGFIQAGLIRGEEGIINPNDERVKRLREFIKEGGIGQPSKIINEKLLNKFGLRTATSEEIGDPRGISPEAASFIKDIRSFDFGKAMKEEGGFVGVMAKYGNAQGSFLNKIMKSEMDNLVTDAKTGETVSGKARQLTGEETFSQFYGAKVASAKVGALTAQQIENRRLAAAAQGDAAGGGDTYNVVNNGGRGDSAGMGSVTAVVNERQRYTRDATGKVNLFGWQGR